MEVFLNELIQSLGYAGVFILMALFATELVMPLAGYMAHTDDLSLLGVVLAGTLGSVLGSVVFYYIARFIDEKTVHGLTSKYGRWVGINARNTARAEAWFDNHARTSVLLGKLLPGVRSATSVVAGYRQMQLRWYLICTFIPTFAWAGILAGIGYYLSRHYQVAQLIISRTSNIFMIVLCLSVAGFLVYRSRYAKRG